MIIIMKNFNRRNSHMSSYYGSKHRELAQHAHSSGSHAFSYTLTSTQLQPRGAKRPAQLLPNLESNFYSEGTWERGSKPEYPEKNPRQSARLWKGNHSKGTSLSRSKSKCHDRLLTNQIFIYEYLSFSLIPLFFVLVPRARCVREKLCWLQVDILPPPHIKVADYGNLNQHQAVSRDCMYITISV